MSENAKITADHLRRCAFVYVRQSSAAQVEHNRESTERQYRLIDRAIDLGWKRDKVSVVDQGKNVDTHQRCEKKWVSTFSTFFGFMMPCIWRLWQVDPGLDTKSLLAAQVMLRHE